MLASTGSLRADEWTLIDVRSRLDNEGRLHVVETHHIVFERTETRLVREFGLGADQAVELKAITRVGPHGDERRLAAGEPDGHDEFRYYERGHVVIGVPALGDNVTLVYRFEYGLVHALAPAWSVPTGHGSLAPGLDLVAPWRRVSALIDEWRAAWPDPLRRYRLEHEVLFPSRDGPGFVVRAIDYRIEYDTYWRNLAPDAEIARVVPDDRYRVVVPFEYLGPAQPPGAALAAGRARAIAIAAIPLGGLLCWLLLMAVERATTGRTRIDRTFIETRFLPLAPEEIARHARGVSPEVEQLLSRLAAEGRLAVHVDPTPGDGDPGAVHMRLLTTHAALTPLERAVIEDLFRGERELSSARLQERHRGTGYDPGDRLRAWMADAARPSAAAQFSPLELVLSLAALGGVVMAAAPLLEEPEALPLAAGGVFFGVMVVGAWPGGWWHAGRPVRGLLVPLVMLFAAVAAFHLSLNRPLAPDVWTGSALAVLAGYALTLVRSRAPASGNGAIARDLSAMRRFAAAELRRPRPRLDDAWIPRLEALGLGRAIERWRARHGGAAAMPPDAGESAQTELLTAARFTGRAPEPFRGPRGWSDALHVYEMDDDDDDEETGEDGAENDIAGDAERRST